MCCLHKPVLILICSMAISAFAASQSLTIDNPPETAYIGNGWFAYEIKASNPPSDGAKLGNTSSFLLSPQYPSPIRCVALKAKCSKTSPTRHLAISPFVNGIENTDGTFSVSSTEAEDEFEIVKIQFDPSGNVTAFRIFLENAGSPANGEWTISRIFVFYGDAEEDEESIIPQIVNAIKTPENLRVTDFSSTSLSIAADPVDKAFGYRFSLIPYEIKNKFEYVETFAATPEMSQTSGWSRDPATSSSYGTYTGAATTDGDLKALNVKGIDVDFVSPLSETAIREYSFMYKNGTSNTAGLGNTICVYGRTGTDGDWEILLREFAFVVDTSKHYVTNSVDPAKGIKQIKISHRAGTSPSKTISFDSLRIASEGEKTASGEIAKETETPECEFTGLAGGWYEFKVQALADPSNARYSDSAWSLPDSIDLAWANIEIPKTEGVTLLPSGEKLTVSWDAVENAEFYLVDVYVPGYPPVYVTQGVETVSTKLVITVPELGEYAAAVTACGPFGKVKGETSSAATEVKMGKTENLRISEMTTESFVAEWDKVAFAEGYEVKIHELSGNASVFTSDYSGMPETLKDSANNVWEMAQYFYGGSGTFNSSRITFNYPDTWIATSRYAEPVTRVEYSFRYAGTPAAAFGTDTILLEGFAAGQWTAIAENAVTAEDQTFSVSPKADSGFSKIRFTLKSTGSPYAVRNIAFGKVSVTCGEVTEKEIRSGKTVETRYSADSLPSDGRFKITVTPLPATGENLASTISPIDLSSARPAVVTGLELSGLENDTYTQNFSALSQISKESDVSSFSLPFWQMFRNGEAATKIKFSKLGGNPTASGIYACCDASLTAESYSLGSLASSTIETIYGIAFTNDCESSVQSFSVSFKAMQRSFKNAGKTLKLEYLATDKMTGIASPGDWKEIEIPATAPYTAENRGEKTFHVQEIAATVADVDIPAGGVLAIRWRDVASPANPLTSIDDVTVQFAFKPLPTNIFIK